LTQAQTIAAGSSLASPSGGKRIMPALWQQGVFFQLRRARRVVAWPLYIMAFVFHLLCTSLTVLAAKIADDPL